MKKRCIFCGGEGKLSKEHIWPVWMHEYLYRQGDGGHSRGSNTFYDKKKVDSNIFKRQGHLSTIRIRAVCQSCNSGWMNELEQEVRPILEKILNSEEILISKEQQQVLSRWIAVKSIVGEFAEKEINVTPESDRRALMEMKVVPEYFAIYIGVNGSESDTAWVRNSNTLALSPTGPDPEIGKLKRNTQTITFICGPLFVFHFATRERGIKSSEYFRFKKIKLLHPVKEQELSWPFSEKLDKNEMGRIAWVLHQLGSYTNVTQAGDSPQGENEPL